MKNSNLVVEFSLKPKRRGTPKDKPTPANTGKLPRVTRLMALAVKFEGMVRDGVVQDYADLARLGHVTRARMTQVMSLLNLAPDIQEELLLLPPVTVGRDPVSERNLRRVTATLRWDRQRKAWREMRAVRTTGPQPALRATRTGGGVTPRGVHTRAGLYFPSIGLTKMRAWSVGRTAIGSLPKMSSARQSVFRRRLTHKCALANTRMAWPRTREART